MILFRPRMIHFSAGGGRGSAPGGPTRSMAGRNGGGPHRRTGGAQGRRHDGRFRRAPIGAGLLLLLLAACASPAERFDREAERLGLRREDVVGTEFTHAVYVKDGRESDSLHVYIEGDGVPITARRPADDPTPRRSLVLRLMAQDPAAAVYLGRPCYHGRRDPACGSTLWTDARYAERVVASLAAAAVRVLAASGSAGITWVGHSGGGVLAMLLAERLPQTRAVVTIAANLDTDAWAAAQGLPLTGSLNPAGRPPLSPQVRQRHYAGGRDRVVPSALVARGLNGASAELAVIDGYDHVCCWERTWPAILAEIDGRD